MAALAGLVLGLSVLNRPAVAVYLPILPVMVWYLARKRLASRVIYAAAIFAVTAAAVVVPWSVHISRISGAPCLVTTVGPGNLWQGLNPWVRDYLDGRMSSQDFLRRLDESTYPLWDQSVPWPRKNQAYRAAVMQFIRYQPAAFYRLMIYRTVKFWQIPGLSSIRTERQRITRPWAVILVGFLSYVPLAVITVWAVFWMLRHRQFGDIAVYVLWIVIAFGSNIWFSSTITRYRFATGIDELMIVISAVFMGALVKAPVEKTRPVLPVARSK